MKSSGILCVICLVLAGCVQGEGEDEEPPANVGPPRFLEPPSDVERVLDFLVNGTAELLPECPDTIRQRVTDADGTTRVFDTIRRALLLCADSHQKEASARSERAQANGTYEAEIANLTLRAADALTEAAPALGTWRTRRSQVDLELDAYLQSFWVQLHSILHEAVPHNLDTHRSGVNPDSLSLAYEGLAQVTAIAPLLAKLAARPDVGAVPCDVAAQVWTRMANETAAALAAAQDAARLEPDAEVATAATRALARLGEDVDTLADHGWYPGLAMQGAFVGWIGTYLTEAVPPVGSQGELLAQFASHRADPGMSFITQYHMDPNLDQVRMSHILVYFYWSHGFTLNGLQDFIAGECS